MKLYSIIQDDNGFIELHTFDDKNKAHSELEKALQILLDEHDVSEVMEHVLSEEVYDNDEGYSIHYIEHECNK